MICPPDSSACSCSSAGAEQRHFDGTSTVKRSHAISLLAVFVGFAMARLALRSSRRCGAKQELTEQVHTWEEEGGSVPDVPTVTLRMESSRFEPSSRTS